MATADESTPLNKPSTSLQLPQATEEAGSGLWVKQVLCGLVVALATIPTSIAYAGIAGVNPLTGIWSSVVLGATCALVGGTPALITGASIVVAVPLGPFVAENGEFFMAAAVTLAAVLELLFAVAKLGRLIELVSEAVMDGFLNGLGMLLVQSQLKVFKNQEGNWLQGAALASTIAVAAGTAIVVLLFPKFTARTGFSLVPSSLVGVVVATALCVLLNPPGVTTLATAAGPDTFKGGLSVLPTLSSWPQQVPMTMASLVLVLPVACSIALIALIETLLAAKLVEAAVTAGLSPRPIYSPRPLDPNRPCLGLALGSFLSACLGGFGGCGLLPQTILNLQSGGNSHLSSIAYALFMAFCVVLFAPLIAAIPLASLAGLMITVAYGTVQWTHTWERTKKFLFKRQDVVDYLALLAANVICFAFDMGLGIIIAVIISQLKRLSKTKPPADSEAPAEVVQ